MSDKSQTRIASPFGGVLRLARAEDLSRLEWFGTYTAHRQIIAEAFAEFERGEGLMLIFDVEDFPIGQLWVRFAGLRPPTARLWALRVMDQFQRRGIAAHLIRTAETLVAQRGIRVCEIGVDEANAAARQLYQRLGYEPSRAVAEPFSYVTPWGESRREIAKQLIVRKLLRLPAGPDHTDASAWSDCMGAFGAKPTRR